MKVIVIGAGFAGLSVASYLAQAGYSVTVVERLSREGGRAQVWKSQGYRFDMGPSWYWMPAEHDRWFANLGQARSKYYRLTKLDPSYRIYFKEGSYDVPGNGEALYQLFDRIEPGSGTTLKKYLKQCQARYEIAMKNFIYRQFSSPLSLVNAATLRNVVKLALFWSYKGVVSRHFRHHHLQQMLSYPTVFLGSSPARTPGVYTLMNWIDFGLGSWYPQGGFGRVVTSMRRVAASLGVRFLFNHQCSAIIADRGSTTGVQVDTPAGQIHLSAQVVVSAADYHHTEQLLPLHQRQFSPRYWQSRALSPSTCNIYVGLNKVFDGFAHHTFFFDSDWDAHFKAVYHSAAHIANPLFYVHAPSVTEADCAPKNSMALFALIPLAPHLPDTTQQRQRYLELVCNRIQSRTGHDIRPHIQCLRIYSHQDYQQDYHAYGGAAFGLGHTLFQTAAFRPPNKSKKVGNLYYCGHWTIPGTGTTMSMISGEMTARRIFAEHPL